MILFVGGTQSLSLPFGNSWPSISSFSIKSGLDSETFISLCYLTSLAPFPSLPPVLVGILWRNRPSGIIYLVIDLSIERDAETKIDWFLRTVGTGKS